jgi:hypothetical protein
MKTTRREFLGGALALAVATQVDASGLTAPTLYGDGVHDDTEGLEAAMNGRPFWADGELVAPAPGEKVYLRGGRFKIHRTVEVWSTNSINGQGAIIRRGEPFVGELMVRFRGAHPEAA